MGTSFVGSINHIMNSKLFALSCVLAVAGAAPTAEADAEADPQFLGAAPYHAAAVVPAANCVTGVEILVTQTCVPAAEDVCNTQMSILKRLSTRRSARRLLIPFVMLLQLLSLTLPITMANVRLMPMLKLILSFSEDTLLIQLLPQL